MDDIKSLSHSVWDCKYHVVFIPKVFRRLARQRESEIEEGQLLPDHVHMLISIPPTVRRFSAR